MCQYRLSICNTYTALMEDVDSGGGCACAGQVGVSGISKPLFKKIKGRRKESLSKDFKKNQREVLELKNTITKIKS